MQETKLKLLERIVDRRQDSLYRFAYIRTGSQADAEDIVQDVLLEVNIGGEESKSGVSPEQLWPLLDAAAAEEHIWVKGLMAIPPVNDDDAQNRRYLAQVYQLFRGKAVLRVENTTEETVELIYELSQSMLKKAEKKEKDLCSCLYALGNVEYVNIVMQNDEVSG